MNPWVQTFSGKKFDLINPSIDSVCLIDIAHALSRICRFNGHVKNFYSVAEHSVYVSNCVPEKYAKEALLHDAHEAYVGDVTSPMKRAMARNAVKRGSPVSDFATTEAGVYNAVVRRFGLYSNTDEHCEDRIKHADLALLATEQERFFPEMVSDWMLKIPPVNIKILGLSPVRARKMFLDRAKKLGIK